MKPMHCSGCNQEFRNTEVRERKFNYYGYDMRCPKCGAWLAPDSRSVLLRAIGFVLWVAGLAIVYLMSESQSQNSGQVITAGFFSLVGMALFAASYKASKLTVKKG
ncbi:MAG: hypothetical protein R3E62_03165 [Pseudomonadales bacterium]|jgi:FtsH-binding integral membrane protein